MDKTLTHVCDLLKWTFFQQEKRPEFLTNDDVDWDALFRELRSQGIYTMAASVLQKMPLPKELSSEWQGQIMKESVRFFRMLDVQDSICKRFSEEGISFVILKGTAAAVYYPMPWLRRANDIDILVFDDAFCKAAEILVAEGFLSDDLISNHTREASFMLGEFEVDLHSKFATEAMKNGEQLDFLLQENRPLPEKTIRGHSFCVLPEHLNGIVLIEHIASHLRTGLGMRQIVDWMMYVQMFLHDDQWEAFRALSDRFGLTKLAMTSTKMGQLYFGLPHENITWCDGADDFLCGELLDLVFQAGEFGGKDSQGSRVTYVMSKMHGGFFRTLQDAGKNNWKLLKKWSFLEPFAWLYQLFRYVIRGISGGTGFISLRRNREKSGRLYRLLQELEQDE